MVKESDLQVHIGYLCSPCPPCYLYLIPLQDVPVPCTCFLVVSNLCGSLPLGLSSDMFLRRPSWSLFKIIPHFTFLLSWPNVSSQHFAWSHIPYVLFCLWPLSLSKNNENCMRTGNFYSVFFPSCEPLYLRQCVVHGKHSINGWMSEWMSKPFI